MANFASGYCETLPVVIDAAGCGLANPFGVEIRHPGDSPRDVPRRRRPRPGPSEAIEGGGFGSP